MILKQPAAKIFFGKTMITCAIISLLHAWPWQALRNFYKVRLVITIPPQMIISAATFTAQSLRCARRQQEGVNPGRLGVNIQFIHFFLFPFRRPSYFVKTLHRGNGLIYGSVKCCSHISFYSSNERQIQRGMDFLFFLTFRHLTAE